MWRDRHTHKLCLEDEGGFVTVSSNSDKQGENRDSLMLPRTPLGRA